MPQVPAKGSSTQSSFDTCAWLAIKNANSVSQVVGPK